MTRLHILYTKCNVHKRKRMMTKFPKLLANTTMTLKKLGASNVNNLNNK